MKFEDNAAQELAPAVCTSGLRALTPHGHNLQDPEGFEENGGWSFLDQEAGDSDEEEGDSEEGDAEFRVGSDDDEDGALLSVFPVVGYHLGSRCCDESRLPQTVHSTACTHSVHHGFTSAHAAGISCSGQEH